MISRFAENESCYKYLTSGNKDGIVENSKAQSLSMLIIDSVIDLISKALPENKTTINLEHIEEFLMWARKSDLILDWRIFIYFLYFVVNKKIFEFHEGDMEALIIYSVSQWTYFDKSLKKEIFVYCNAYPNMLFRGEKSSIASKPRKVFMRKLSDKEKEFVKLNKETIIF